jgi:transketolase
MLNKALNLNPKLFAAHPTEAAIRAGYGTGLFELGGRDKRIVVLTADLTDSTQCAAFARAYPERFIEIGVAEQNLATVASGLAANGKIPFISSYATFSPGRNWEQIRTTICYNDVPVKIAGHHAGISVGPDGATHQATEDIALMSVLPNMTVFVPCDAQQAHKATVAAARIESPVYLRFQREKTPVITTAKTPFAPGKVQVLWQGKKPSVVIAACGGMVYRALLAAKELESAKIDSVVLNVHTIKPLDTSITTWAAKTGALVSVEEHQINGGLGSAIAQLLAKTNPVPMEFVGLADTFGESGEPEELLNKYGLSVSDIVHSAKKAIKRK